MGQYMVNKIVNQKPDLEDYPVFYHKYVESLPAGNLLHILEDQLQAVNSRLGNIDAAKWLYRYAEGKWSVKELLAHMIDAERIFAYRALTFARNDHNQLPGFEENDYVKVGNFDKVDEGTLLGQLNFLRKSNILLYSTFGDEELGRKGVSNGKEITVRALVFITAGHLQHHLNVLHERYAL